MSRFTGARCEEGTRRRTCGMGNVEEVNDHEYHVPQTVPTAKRETKFATQ